MIAFIWNSIIKQPLELTLVWFAHYTGNLGWAIILLTIVVQLLLTPLRLPSLRSAKKIRILQPEINKLKEQHKEDKMAFAQAQMELYKEHKVNPFGGLLPTLLSLPFIFALYQVLLQNIKTITDVSTSFLWIPDVTTPDPLYILPVAVGILQYFALKIAQHPPSPSEKAKRGSQEDIMQSVQTQMMYIFPIVSAFITATLPAGVGLYWFISVVFAIMQQKLLEVFEKNGS